MNKSVLAFALALLVGTVVSSAKKHRQSDVVVSVTPGSVTFSVEDVKIAKQPLPDMDGEDLALNWLEWSERDSYLGASFADKTLVDGGDNPFFSMVCLAYATSQTHYPYSRCHVDIDMSRVLTVCKP